MFKKNLLLVLCVRFSKQKLLLCEITLDYPCDIVVNIGKKK